MQACSNRPTTTIPLQHRALREDAYRISLAMADFGMNDITVTAEQDTLTYRGQEALPQRG
jgi:HSP20 family molecular chaperone IbpA